MLRFDEFLQEKSLTRVKSKSDTGPIAIISASRGNMTSEENKQRSRQLVQDIKAAGLPGPTQVAGRYTEKFGTPEAIPVKEQSFIVTPAQGMSSEEFENIIVSLGKKYNQDSILIQTQFQGTAELVGTSADAWPGDGERVSVGTMHPGKAGEFDTQVKGKTFTFETNEMNKNKKDFPYDYVIDESKKIVWIRFTSNYPTVLGIPSLVKEHFGPEYQGRVASTEFLQHLKESSK